MSIASALGASCTILTHTFGATVAQPPAQEVIRKVTPGTGQSCTSLLAFHYAVAELDRHLVSSLYILRSA